MTTNNSIATTDERAKSFARTVVLRDKSTLRSTKGAELLAPSEDEKIIERSGMTTMPVKNVEINATEANVASFNEACTKNKARFENDDPIPLPDDDENFKAFLAECGLSSNTTKKIKLDPLKDASLVLATKYDAGLCAPPHVNNTIVVDVNKSKGKSADSIDSANSVNSAVFETDTKAIDAKTNDAAMDSAADAIAITATSTAKSSSNVTNGVTIASSSSTFVGTEFGELREVPSDSLQDRCKHKHEFWRSLQFRVMMVFAFAGLIATAALGVMSYLKTYNYIQEFIDEELSQISQIAINYRMVLPKRWESPKYMRERVVRLRNDNGRIVVEYGSVRKRNEDSVEAGSTNATESSANSNGNAGINRGLRRGMGMGYGLGMGPQANIDNGNKNEAKDERNDQMPSIEDLRRFNYDIIIAPLYGRPGDALYIPPGVKDGFYTVMVADQRVRAVVVTNLIGQRFVVARPLSSMEQINSQALLSSIWQFLSINLLFIPLLMISVRMMFFTLNRTARALYKRTDDDLGPVIPENNHGFVPSELDSFVLSLNRLFSRVNESIQSKRRFIADAAHEMRTPLTALSLQAESLEKEELSPSARRKVERLKEGIARERELMTALLTLAREQNRVDLSLEKIDILQVFTKLIDEQGLLADQRNIDLGVEGEAHYTIVSDRLRLMRVMSNLVSNAIKYTPDGGRIDLMAQPLEDGSLKLIVQDNGQGIPPEQLRHILEPFYRVNGDRSEVQGTGLGLAIVKASCDSIKAKLAFTNAVPHGLIVTVTVPSLIMADVDSAKQNAAASER